MLNQTAYKIYDKQNSDYSSLISDLAASSGFVIDLETTGFNMFDSKFNIVGIGFSWGLGVAAYIHIGCDSQFLKIVLEDFRFILESDKIPKYGQNIKYDLKVLSRLGIKVSNIAFDTMVANYCLYSTRCAHNLDDMSMYYFNFIKIRTKHVIPKSNKTNKNPTMNEADATLVANYCMEDCDLCYRIVFVLKNKLDLDKEASYIFNNIDMPLVEVLTSMETDGVKIDTNILEATRVKLVAATKTLMTELEAIAGRPVDINKTNDLQKAIYDELKIHQKYDIPVKKTPKGNKKTDVKTLELYKDHPFINKLLEIKTYQKLISTYCTPIPAQLSDMTGMLHASFNQTITATGRLGSSGPNLQNIPTRTEVGKEIRAAFVSRFPGGKILSSDYSQAELRILGHLSQEPIFLEVYREGADLKDKNNDIHTRVASMIYNTPVDKITKDQRRASKTINFGLLYGMRENKLAKELGISKREAQYIMNSYLGNLKYIKMFIDNAHAFLYDNGYTETVFGRKRYISKIYSNDEYERYAAQREAANFIVQGTNADIIKLAMRAIYDLFKAKKLESKLIIQVHDELVFDVHPDEIDIVGQIVKEKMENVAKLSVPMISEASFAESWALAH